MYGEEQDPDKLRKALEVKLEMAERATDLATRTQCDIQIGDIMVRPAGDRASLRAEEFKSFLRWAKKPARAFFGAIE
jgi:hypothetical protein